MEINVESLLASGMSPESIGEMVRMEAAKQAIKQKDKKNEQVAAARQEAATALDKYFNLILDLDEPVDFNSAADLEDVFKEIEEEAETVAGLIKELKKTARSKSKVESSEEKKCDCEKSAKSRDAARPHVRELSEEQVNAILRDFLGTL